MTQILTRKHRTQLVQGAKQDGIEDYCAGVPVQLCPYQRRAYRRAWIKGWYHADREMTRALMLQRCDVSVIIAPALGMRVAA